MKKIFIIFNLLSAKEKNLFYLIIVLTFFSMIVEILGLSTVIPLISIVLKNDLNFSSNIFSNLIRLFDKQNKNIVELTLIAIGVVFILKNIYLAFFSKFLVKFLFNVSKRLEQELYEGYIKLPYLDFINKKNADLVYNLTRAIDLFRDSLSIISLLITELLVFCGILTFLFIIDPITLFIIGSVLLSVFLILYFLSKKKNIEWGKNSRIQETLRVKTIIESFNAIKELKIKNIENFFFRQHLQSNNLKAKFATKHNFNVYLPRLFFEVIILFVILSLVFVLRELNFSQADLIKKIGLFSVAAFRLYPSAYKIINSIQNFNFGLPSLENLVVEIKKIKNNQSNFLINNNSTETYSGFNFESIALKNIYFSYPDQNNYIIKNLEFEIKKNEIVGISGKSGSGKSTLIDIISGLFNPNKGYFFINNKKYLKLPRYWNNSFAYVSQNIALLENTLTKNITFGEDNDVDKKRLKEVVEIAQLQELFENQIEENYLVGNRGVKLSGGEKQRIGIARALYYNNKFLILDEATNALDEKTERKIMEGLLNTKNLTILLISHKSSTLNFCKKQYFLENGVLKKLN